MTDNKIDSNLKSLSTTMNAKSNFDLKDQHFRFYTGHWYLVYLISYFCKIWSRPRANGFAILVFNIHFSTSNVHFNITSRHKDINIFPSTSSLFIRQCVCACSFTFFHSIFHGNLSFAGCISHINVWKHPDFCLYSSFAMYSLNIVQSISLYSYSHSHYLPE